MVAVVFLVCVYVMNGMHGVDDIDSWHGITCTVCMRAM